MRNLFYFGIIWGCIKLNKVPPGSENSSFIVLNVDGISKSTYLNQTTDASSVLSWVADQWQGAVSRVLVASSQRDRTLLDW